MIRALLLAAAAALLGCAPPGPVPGGGTAVAGDTLRGVVQVVGSEPLTSVVLEPAGGGAAVTLEGARPLLLRLQGIEVAVGGARQAVDRFRVDELRVRSANGVAAVDGVLAREDGRDVLVLADGARRVIRSLPGALRGRMGARVWLAGPLEGDIDAFGIITEAP